MAFQGKPIEAGVTAERSKSIRLDRQAILRNYLSVQERVAQAAKLVGQDPAAVKIVVVTKGHSIEAVGEAIAAGLTELGENYVEEGLAKMQAFKGHPQLCWHMIGHVQSRKAHLVSERFDYLHSLDSLKLAGRLERFAAQAGRVLPVLLECNVSGERSKFGWPAWEDQRWEDLVAPLGELVAYPHLEVRGLMTMAPYLPEPEDTRPFFRRLRRLQAFLEEKFPLTDWRELSMGMSADFEVAVQEGATMVRVGTAIMGARP